MKSGEVSGGHFARYLDSNDLKSLFEQVGIPQRRGTLSDSGHREEDLVPERQRRSGRVGERARSVGKRERGEIR